MPLASLNALPKSRGRTNPDPAAETIMNEAKMAYMA
jgi:hypothetical protein